MANEKIKRPTDFYQSEHQLNEEDHHVVKYEYKLTSTEKIPFSQYAIRKKCMLSCSNTGS